MLSFRIPVVSMQEVPLFIAASLPCFLSIVALPYSYFRIFPLSILNPFSYVCEEMGRRVYSMREELAYQEV